MQYAIVLDAGSSGTRLYVYRWVQWVQDHPPPRITLVCTADTADGRGIATCEDAAAVAAHLDPLFAAAHDNAAAHAGNLDLDPLDFPAIHIAVTRETIPLSVLGTAGLRDFRDDNGGDAYQALVDLVVADLVGRGYNAAACRAISGKEEAVYGWVAANYTANRFAPGVLPHGYVEMGGASTQIAYPPTDLEMASYTGDLVRLYMGGRHYDLYAKSFPFGAEKAWSKHEEKLRAPGMCQHQTRAQCDCPDIIDPCRPQDCNFEIPRQGPVGARITGGGNDYRRCVYTANRILRLLREGGPADGRAGRVQHRTNFAAAVERDAARRAKAAAERAAAAVSDAKHQTIVAHHLLAGARQRSYDAAIAETAAPGDAAAIQVTAGAAAGVVKAQAAAGAASAAEAAAVAASNAAADAADKAEVEAEEAGDAAQKIVAAINGPYPAPRGPDPEIYPRPLQQSLDLLEGGPAIDFGARVFAGGAQFWYTTRMVFGRDIVGNSLADPFSYLDFRAEVQQLMLKRWEHRPSGVPEKFWMKAFFVAGFMTNVLYFGFNFPRPLSRQERHMFQPYNGKNNTLSWTLGKVLLDAVALPGGLPGPTMVRRWPVTMPDADWMAE